MDLSAGLRCLGLHAAGAVGLSHMEGNTMTERLSASTAGRHIACHASANLEMAITGYVRPVDDRTATNAANDGTNVHSVFEKVWEMSASDMRYFVRTVSYVADLRATRRFKVLIEQPMKATWLVQEPTTTADLVLSTQDQLEIIDTKWGKIHVDVHDNEQLLFYAATYAPLAPKAKGVTLHILQPRADNIESVFVTVDEIKKFMAEVQAAEAAIMAGDLTFGPSDHCMFCSANPHSRGRKAEVFCPPMLNMLYPKTVNEDEILAL